VVATPPHILPQDDDRSMPERYRCGVERVGGWERLRRVDQRTWDALLALAVLTYVLAAFLSTAPAASDAGSVTVPVVLLVTASVPLAWRRRAPLSVAWIVVVSDVVLSLTGHETRSVICVIIAVYSTAAYTDGRTLIFAVPPLAAVGIIPLVANHWRLVDALLAVTWDAVIPFVFGRIMFDRRLRIAHDRVLAAQDAVTVERARIARELHDIVAHHMGVMVVQAAAAGAVADRDPAAVREALHQIEDSGRAGLAEMRRLLDILSPDQRDERAPQPGLGRLDQLIEEVRASGLPVERVIEGSPRALPAGVDLTAYRIVQEALTNTLSHAGDAHARVLLRFEPDCLEIEVADDGRGDAARSLPGAGRGLIGMRERVQLFGGTLVSGPRPGGGFLVRAGLPLTKDAPT
jgi:signal transduction histidine kinase